MAQNNAEKVSPTAYATGYFWYRHGMSHPALATPQGKRLDRAFGLMIKGTRALSGVSLEAMMLARHKGIDAVLSQAIDDGRIGQVIEIAAGLSPRGWSFTKRYGDTLTYIETDLPQMAALKRKLLEDAGLLSERHRVIELDALADSGPQSLAVIVKSLNPKLGTAIITEGLMNYLPQEAAYGLWQRIAKMLQQFPHGIYLSDAYLKRENYGAAMIVFGAILSVFVRGRMYAHLSSEHQAEQLLRSFGFDQVALRATADIPATRELSSTPGADHVQVLEATV